MIRTFHPVGQGAFYTEEFTHDCFTMICDCGSYTGKTIIEDEIKKSGLKKEIDLLVISHFHGDHINGLEYLFKNHIIKNILLPFLHNEDKIEIFFQNIRADEFIKNLCLYPKETINQVSKSTKIIFVAEYNSEDKNNSEESISLSEIEKIIDSGKTIRIDSKWMYIPFNFRFKTRSSQLKKRFIHKKIPLNIDDFLAFYKTNKKVVIDAYESITGDMNTNSLVLYSGINKQPIFSLGYPILNCFPFCYGHQENVACLYMGDYNAKGATKMKELEKAFSKIQYLGTIQIPHHGSRHNYNPLLNLKKNLISVISAGIDNTYKHPHCSTLKQIVLHSGIPIIVTEKSSTKFIQKIIYYEDMKDMKDRN